MFGETAVWDEQWVSRGEVKEVLSRSHGSARMNLWQAQSAQLSPATLLSPKEATGSSRSVGNFKEQKKKNDSWLCHHGRLYWLRGDGKEVCRQKSKAVLEVNRRVDVINVGWLTWKKYGGIGESRHRCWDPSTRWNWGSVGSLGVSGITDTIGQIH